MPHKLRNDNVTLSLIKKYVNTMRIELNHLVLLLSYATISQGLALICWIILQDSLKSLLLKSGWVVAVVAIVQVYIFNFQDRKERVNDLTVFPNEQWVFSIRGYNDDFNYCSIVLWPAIFTRCSVNTTKLHCSRKTMLIRFCWWVYGCGLVIGNNHFFVRNVLL